MLAGTPTAQIPETIFFLNPNFDIYTNQGCFSFEIQIAEEIETGTDIRNQGGKSRSFGFHSKDKNE